MCVALDFGPPRLSAAARKLRVKKHFLRKQQRAVNLSEPSVFWLMFISLNFRCVYKSFTNIFAKKLKICKLLAL